MSWEYNFETRRQAILLYLNVDDSARASLDFKKNTSVKSMNTQ